MQSSYNVIKNGQILKQGSKQIITCNYFGNALEEYGNYLSGEVIQDANIYPVISEAELAAKNIVEVAKLERKVIMNDAKEAFKKAEKDGYAAGSERGYNEAYEKELASAKKNAEKIIINANNILFDSKIKYEKYLEEKREDIIKLSITIAEKILQKEVSFTDALDNLIYKVLDDSKNAKTFVIKTNSIYIEELRLKVDNWKENLGIKGEIFIVADETISAGNAIVEKNNGKVEVGINVGIEGIRQALL